MKLHVWPVVAASAPGSGLQVTVRWNDGFVDLSDDTIISLDTLTSGAYKSIPMWLGYSTVVTIEATLFGAAGAQYGIDWDVATELV